MADPLPAAKAAHQAKAPPRKISRHVHKSTKVGSKPLGWGSGRAKHTLKGAPLAEHK